jgi:tRNA(fMet)-specific endonuclease VapC
MDTEFSCDETAVKEWFRRCYLVSLYSSPGYPVRLNAVSYYETKRGLLAIGAVRQLAAFERLWRVLGIVMIDHAVLDKAAELYAELRVRGQLIEDADLLIAAIALVHDMTLVTNNTAHFTRIPGLHIEDWLNS